MKLRVLAGDGRYIPGYGSRAQGEIFELPDDVGQAYLDQYPDDYEEVGKAKGKRRASADQESEVDDGS